MSADRYVSRSQLARMAGVSAAAVTMACNKTLQGAVFGRKVDIEHPDVVEWLKVDRSAGNKAPRKKKDVVPVEKKRGQAAFQQKKRDQSLQNISDMSGMDVDMFGNMTINQILSQFGTETAFGEWVKMTKVLEEIREKRIKNAKTQGELISREYVRTHMFGLIEIVNTRLLNDAPVSLAARVSQLVRAGEDDKSVEDFIRSEISTHIGALKSRMTTAVKHA